MELTNDQLAAVIVWGIIIMGYVIIFAIIGIVWFIASPKLRMKSKRILPPTTTFYGATHVLQNQDQREAIEHLN